MTSYTQCFRSEAGAAGKDTRGMLRQHQFSKVELVSITTPENSDNELESMLECAEGILKDLHIPYRVVLSVLEIWDFQLRKHMTLKCGCQVKIHIEKFRVALIVVLSLIHI